VATVSEPIGVVADLWRFPVKSMRGERLPQAELENTGLAGDRAFALIDTETGAVVSATNARQFPGVLGCKAAFVEAPRSGSQLPPVRITFPDAKSATSDAADLDQVLSAYFSRDVTLVRTVPESYANSQAAWFGRAGLLRPTALGSFVDLYPVSVITTATLAGLDFDQRRFRMNVLVRTNGIGFLENHWVDRQLAIGGAARLKVAMPDPRCVMTTLAQEELPKDPEVLRTIARKNSLPIGSAGPMPCAGVYALCDGPGTIRIGDSVALG
jgi:MOSC domain-containing protein